MKRVRLSYLISLHKFLDCYLHRLLRTHWQPLQLLPLLVQCIHFSGPVTQVDLIALKNFLMLINSLFLCTWRRKRERQETDLGL